MERPDWDTRYREGFYDGAVQPHKLLTEWCSNLPPGGRVVDIAMGNGRDLLFLAEKGFACYGLERSQEALRIAGHTAHDRRLFLSVVKGDALHLPFKEDSFDGLFVFYFLERQIMTDLVGLLRPGGILIYETFLKKQNAFDRQRNPEYLLDDAELIGLFQGLEIVLYEEGIFRYDGKQRAVARYVGRKR